MKYIVETMLSVDKRTMRFVALMTEDVMQIAEVITTHKMLSFQTIPCELKSSSHLCLFRKSGTTDRIAARDSYNIR